MEQFSIACLSQTPVERRRRVRISLCIVSLHALRCTADSLCYGEVERDAGGKVDTRRRVETRKRL